MRNVSYLASLLADRRPGLRDRLCSCRRHVVESRSRLRRSVTKDSLTTLTKGAITFGTDQPAYSPWFIDDDPANGKGFESAVAYAVADELGYAKEDVTWVRVPFNAAIAPGPKTFDANLNEFSITDERKQAVDFSSPYFDVTQAVVTVKSSPAAKATTLDGLKGLKLGAQVGTTSYTAANGASTRTSRCSTTTTTPRPRCRTVRSTRW